MALLKGNKIPGVNYKNVTVKNMKLTVQKHCYTLHTVTCHLR